jgi:hypothetical protein
MQSSSDQPHGRAPGELLPAFEELRPALDSGDVLLFGGDGLVCSTIKAVTRSRWSHVALVVRPHPAGPPLLWEATAAPELPDLVRHEIRPGVNLFDLEQWVRHYAGRTALRRLHVARTEAMRAALLAFFHEVHGRPFEQRRLQLFRSMYDGPLGANREEDLSSLFCSELVAASYQRMGLLSPHPPSNEYTPRDFSSDRETPLPLLLEASLGDEVIVCHGP